MSLVWQCIIIWQMLFSTGPWKIWSYVKHPWQKPETGTSTPTDSPSKSSKEPKEMEQLPIIPPNISPTIPTNIPIIVETQAIIDTESATITCCTASRSKSADYREQNKTDIDKLLLSRSPSKGRGGKKEHISRKKKSSLTSTISNKSDVEDNVLPYRLDYTLRDMGMANNYLSAITSHTSYWNNYDIAHFILSNLQPEVASDEETWFVRRRRDMMQRLCALVPQTAILMAIEYWQSVKCRYVKLISILKKITNII